MPDEELNILALILSLALWGAAPICLIVMIRRGALSARAFAAAPPRHGVMGLHDVFLTVGLLMLGLWVLGAAVGRGWVRIAEDGADAMLQVMILSQLAALPAIVYILWRAETAVVRGMAGLGLSLWTIPRSLRRAAIVLIAVFPVMAAISGIVAAILWLGGHEPPMVAHEALEVLVQAEIGSTIWWGLVISAVVIAPVVEELIFRGMVQTALLQSRIMANRWTVIACSALPFTLIHAGVAAPHALPGLYVLALGLGWAYERWGSLWTPILMHALFNGVQVALVMTIVQPNAS